MRKTNINCFQQKTSTIQKYSLYCIENKVYLDIGEQSTGHCPFAIFMDWTYFQCQLWCLSQTEEGGYQRMYLLSPEALFNIPISNGVYALEM